MWHCYEKSEHTCSYKEKVIGEEEGFYLLKIRYGR